MTRTLHYGPRPSNVGDIYLPPHANPPVVCLLHGGFWRMPYGRDQMSSIAGDLCNRGFAVWNIEYRRIGEPLVGWDEISSDVLAALEFLQDYSERERRLDMSQVALAFRVNNRCSDIAVFVISQYGKGEQPEDARQYWKKQFADCWFGVNLAFSYV